MVNEQQTVAERCKRGCSDRDAARCWPLGTVRKGPCSCACHPKSEPLTPSERALAKILAALEDYQSDPKERSEIRRPLERLHDQVLWSGLNPRGFTGATLLARARKAGVL